MATLTVRSWSHSFCAIWRTRMGSSRLAGVEQTVWRWVTLQPAPGASLLAETHEAARSASPAVCPRVLHLVRCLLGQRRRSVGREDGAPRERMMAGGGRRLAQVDYGDLCAVALAR